MTESKAQFQLMKSKTSCQSCRCARSIRWSLSICKTTDSIHPRNNIIWSNMEQLAWPCIFLSFSWTLQWIDLLTTSTFIHSYIGLFYKILDVSVVFGQCEYIPLRNIGWNISNKWLKNSINWSTCFSHHIFTIIDWISDCYTPCYCL